MNSPQSPTTLEVLIRSPQRKTSFPPLLFIHGAFTSAWCWDDFYLPFFAAAGYEAHAVSLSGHGRSRGRDHLDSLSVHDYVNDVREIAAAMPRHPILVGHSMGGFVVQKYLEQHVAPAAVLMCSVPPQGLMSAAVDMMLMRPSLMTDLNRVMTGGHPDMKALRTAMFAQPISLEEIERFYRHSQPESHRAMWDMTLLNLPRVALVKRTPLLVIGADRDQVIPLASVHATARTYEVEASVFHGMGHGIMLERDWELPAKCLLAWLKQIGVAQHKCEGSA